MKKFLFCFLLFILSFSFCSSQSRIQMEKEYSLYKINKVKTEIITSDDGNKTVTKLDKDGKRIEIKGYNGRKEINITSYKYDNKGNMIEESYYGYESGDGYTTYFYYDEQGNVIKSKLVGSDENEIKMKYDEFGNLIETEYIDISSNPGPPYFLEYKNNYENGKLISSENLCTAKTDAVYVTQYSYDSDNVILLEEYEKNCRDNSTKLSSQKKFIYLENGLIKESTYQSEFKEKIQKNIYTYEFYN